MLSVETVMITGYFDPLHDAHLDYFKQAVMMYRRIICIVASDKQTLIKKGKVNIPEDSRREIVSLVLSGLTNDSLTLINVWDKDKSIAKVLEVLQPDFLLRGYDKSLETMPEKEQAICEKLNIKIVHAVNRIGERHGAEMRL